MNKKVMKAFKVGYVPFLPVDLYYICHVDTSNTCKLLWGEGERHFQGGRREQSIFKAGSRLASYI